jgi:hypothetical protein
MIQRSASILSVTGRLPARWIAEMLSIHADGTTNFVHGFPFACISIGLIYERRPTLGIIYNPFLDHLVCSYSLLCVIDSHRTEMPSTPV